MCRPSTAQPSRLHATPWPLKLPSHRRPAQEQYSRLEAGYAKQQELATAMGVKQQSVSRWEKGLGRPRAAEIPKLEKLVGAKPAELSVAASFGAEAVTKAEVAETATSFDRALPLSALAPEIFESFCAALLDRLYRTLNGDVHRYGGMGSKQHGIDIVASGQFGTHTFQCKRVNEFGTQKVHTAVCEQTYKADLKVLLLSCVASPKARDSMAAHAGWQLWDREDIALVKQFMIKQRLLTRIPIGLTLLRAALAPVMVFLAICNGLWLLPLNSLLVRCI